MVLLIGSCKQVNLAYNNQNCDSSRSYPEADTSCYVVTISKVNATKQNTECLTIEGYIFYIYTCPPCPRGVLCKPCAPDHFYVSSDKNRSIEDGTFTESEILIYATNACQFKKSKRYTFSTERTGQELTDQDKKKITIYNNNLKGYSLITDD